MKPASAAAGWWRWDGADLWLEIHAQPAAQRDEFAGEHGGRLKVRVSGVAVDGKANDGLARFLAKAFGVPKSQVELAHGHTSRHKRFRIHAPRALPVALVDAGISINLS